MDAIRKKQGNFNDDVKVRDIKDWLRKNPGFAASVASEAIKARREEISPIKKELEQANNFLSQIDHVIQEFVIAVKKGVIGGNMVPVGVSGQLRESSDEERVLDIANSTASYKTFKQAATEDITAAISNAWKSVTTKRGLVDLIMGDAEPGSWRDSGRKYKDALEQYRRDRWLQDQASKEDPKYGKSRLMEAFGSEKDANKAIDIEFSEQQKIARKLRKVEAEIARRRSVGMMDDEINSEAGGKLLDEMSRLAVQFAKYQPTRAGAILENQIQPGFHRKKSDNEHFDANQSVHPSFKTKNNVDVDLDKHENFNVFKLNPIREIAKGLPEGGYKVVRSNREIPLEFPKLDVDLTNKGSVMHSQKKAKKALAEQQEAASPDPITAPVVGQQSSRDLGLNVFHTHSSRTAMPVPAEPGTTGEELAEESDRRHEQDQEVQKEQIGILREIRDALKNTIKKENEEDKSGETGSSIFSLIGEMRGVVEVLKGIGNILKGGKAVLGSLGKAAGAAGAGAGALIGKAAPYALPAAGVAAAGAAGYGVGTLFNKGWEKLTGNSFGGSLYNVFGNDDKVNKALRTVPIPTKPAPKEVFPLTPSASVPKTLKPVMPPMAATKLEQTRLGIEAAKEDKTKESSPTTLINAPTINTVNNSSPASGAATFTIRNNDKTITDYIRSRYKPS
jgi:hypothetical protein